MSRLSDWRENARHCVERVYDAENLRRFRNGDAKRPGNALCAYGIGTHRCTFNLCPLVKRVAAPTQSKEERHE